MHHVLCIYTQTHRKYWEEIHLETDESGNSLAAQWLGLCAFTAWVQSMVGEPRSYKPRGQKKKKKFKNFHLRSFKYC